MVGQVTVLFANPADFAGMNEEYAEVFATQAPTRGHQARSPNRCQMSWCAGHADIVRELIDGATGLLPGNGNMASRDQAGWADHRNQVEQAAKAAGR